MLAGLMSVCMTPLRCIPATARASSKATSVTSRGVQGIVVLAMAIPPTSASRIVPWLRRRRG